MGDHEQGRVDAGVRRPVRVSSRTGRVEVVAEVRTDVVAEKAGEPLEVGDDAGLATVSSRRSALVVRVPEGSDVVIGTISGAVSCTGRLGQVAISTVSARIDVEHADQVDARSMSGRITIARCDGEVRCDAVSGRAEVGSAGAARLSTMSGRITARAVRGKVRARTVNGRIEVALTDTPIDVKAEAVNGRIQVRVPRGARPRAELSAKRGSVRNEVPEGDDGFITARTVNGRVVIDEAR
jgi:DUF4097 and DUF4098 domain-containing protein YvlB